MLSQEAELALGQLESGAVFNTTHTTARELIAAGLCSDNWGMLALTETGRRQARYYAGSFRIIDEHVADLSRYQNPMGLGPEVPSDIGFLPSAADMKAAHAEIESTPAQPTPPKLPPDAYDYGLRAAGIASGKTGEWPTSEWVHAFIDALEGRDK